MSVSNQYVMRDQRCLLGKTRGNIRFHRIEELFFSTVQISVFLMSATSFVAALLLLT